MTVTYQANFPRHLLAIARHLQSSLMHALTEQRGHRGLKLYFGSIMTLISSPGARITDLAEQLSVSKQAVNQTINQIEAAGYVQRQADPSDRRAKRVVLTPLGRQLMADGSDLLTEIEAEFATMIGHRRVKRLTQHLAELYSALELVKPSSTAQQSSLGWLLPRISDYTTQRLMILTRDRGHPALKLSYAQVLTFMGPNGGRIQQMARINEVSKQAIGSIAHELEELGYLYRETDSVDGRQVLLKFTVAGAKLIEDSVAAIVELEEEFSLAIGQTAMGEIQADSLALYKGLRIEAKIFTDHKSGPGQLMKLAASLQQQLGASGARALADILINIGGEKS
jgi:DNA-binding MarR family transcriptional regulator